MGAEEKIRAIEEEMARTQYHKGTEHHFGFLKAKLAKLRKEQLRSAKKKGKRFAVRKGGDATVILIGPSLAGKSALFNALTNGKSAVSGHPFTTQEVVPGIMRFNGAQIQVLDTPPLEIARREVLSVAAIADLTVFVIDVFQRDFEAMGNEIDAVNGGEVLVVINKADADEEGALKRIRERFAGSIQISVSRGTGIDALKREIYKRLRLIRIYMKPRGEKADYSKPFVAREGDTVGDAWEKLRLHGKMRYAMVWGRSAKFSGQKVSEEHVLADGDVLSIVKE